MHASGKAELDSGEKQVANDLLELTELFVDELARGTMHLSKMSTFLGAFSTIEDTIALV